MAGGGKRPEEKADYALLLALALLVGIACLTLVPRPIDKIVDSIARLF